MIRYMGISESILGGQKLNFGINVKIIGDVKNPLVHINLDPGEMKSVKYEGEDISVIEAEKLIDKALPIYPGKIFLMGGDGLTAEVSYEDLNGSLFAVKEEGLCFLTRHFPVNTQVKGIQEIIVRCDEKALAKMGKPHESLDLSRKSGESSSESGENLSVSGDKTSKSSEKPLKSIQKVPGTEDSSPDTVALKGIFVISGNKLSFKSLGELLTLPSWQQLVKVGESTRTVEGHEYKGVVYQSRKLISVSSILSFPAKKIAVYTKDGDIVYTDADSRLQVNSPHGMVLYGTAVEVKKLIGIMADPPSARITDVAEDVLEKVEQGEKVMVIYVDGLGYDIYEKAKGQGYLPFISSFGKAQKALTVFPPITDVAFTSMVTGKTPLHTGIKKRGDSELKCDTVFDKLSRLGKKFVVVEGNIKILNDDVSPVLNTDENKNGLVDDEILNSSIKEIKDDPDVLLVHFHSYDDMAHKYGPYAPEAMKQLKVIDDWTKELVNSWKGYAIIVSDHGMHEEDGAGTHGSFCREDLYIPLIYGLDSDFSVRRSL